MAISRQPGQIATVAEGGEFRHDLDPAITGVPDQFPHLPLGIRMRRSNARVHVKFERTALIIRKMPNQKIDPPCRDKINERAVIPPILLTPRDIEHKTAELT